MKKTREPIEFAFEHYGQKEVLGPEANPEIMKFFHDLGFNWVKDDAVAWCAAFQNWCNMKAGHPTTGTLLARDFLKIGKQIEFQDLQFGDTVVFSRPPETWAGHVGRYINFIDPLIYVIGGNQNNQINIDGFPKERFLGARRTEIIEPIDPEANSPCWLCANYISATNGNNEGCVKVNDRTIPKAYFQARFSGKETECSLKAPIL
jgi:uncharacterized protein (TIGR02594 family)